MIKNDYNKEDEKVYENYIFIFFIDFFTLIKFIISYL